MITHQTSEFRGQFIVIGHQGLDEITTMARGHEPERSLFEWIFVFLALVLAAVHLYLGVVAESVTAVQSRQFVVVSGFFLAGLLLYASPYWRSPLYLVFVLFATSLGWIWLFGGLQHLAVGVPTALVTACFTLVCAYLFYTEEVRAARLTDS